VDVSGDPALLKGFASEMAADESALAQASLRVARLSQEFSAPREFISTPLDNPAWEVLQLAEEALELESFIAGVGDAFQRADSPECTAGPITVSEKALDRALSHEDVGFPAVKQTGDTWIVHGSDGHDYPLSLPSPGDGGLEGWAVVQRLQGITHLGPRPSVADRIAAAAQLDASAPFIPAGRSLYEHLVINRDGTVKGLEGHEPGGGFETIDDPPEPVGKGNTVGAAVELLQTAAAVGANEVNLGNRNLYKYQVVYERNAVTGERRAIVSAFEVYEVGYEKVIRGGYVIGFGDNGKPVLPAGPTPGLPQETIITSSDRTP
jgi:hypothetical protein